MKGKDEMSLGKKMWTLFVTTFTISMTANSGYAIIGVLKRTFAEKYHWFSEDEMNNAIAIGQSAPGPIAVNSSAVIGYETCGFFGAFSAVMGVILPPIVIMLLVTVFYEKIVGSVYVAVFMKGMQAGVIGMLLDIVIGMYRNLSDKKAVYPYIVMLIAFLFCRFSSFSLFYLVVGCILAGVIKSLLIGKKVKP